MFSNDFNVRFTMQGISNDLIVRFTEVGTENVFEQFKLLIQTSSLNQYYDGFERLIGLVICKLPQLIEKFFVANFVGGLKEEN